MDIVFEQMSSATQTKCEALRFKGNFNFRYAKVVCCDEWSISFDMISDRFSLWL